MTGRGKQKIGGFRKSVLLLSVFGLLSCTMGRPANLPDRSSIMPGETITVEGNQNVYAVAKAHNVPMREIIVLNNLQPPFAIKSGQKLILPMAGSGSSSMVPVSGGSMPAPAPVSSAAVEQTALPPIQSAPVQSEQLAPPPPVSKPVGSPAVEALNTKSVAPAPVTTTVTSSQSQQVATLAPGGAPSVPPPAPAAEPEPSIPFTAVWPVQGPLLSGFGPKAGGLNNDGVNIGAPKGSPVLAAASGIVVYAGNEMKGFGNLILIRHQGGWVTAYAHLDRVLVNKDAVVAQGDMIGTVGKTGNVPTPQLHFETRYEGKPVDPKSVIKAGG
jgi:murein DD-endopeptidase MepM/ murein hydrolase activator NlpD